MSKKAIIQESWTSGINPVSLCAFDYEAIEKPTKALMHQAARFMYFNKGIGKIKIDGVEFDIRPHTLCAITPWRVTDIIDVRDTLHLSLIVYDYQFLNTVLKFTPGLEEESVSLLNFLLSHPVIYLDKEQSSRIDHIMSSLQGELGVDSAVLSQRNKPITFLYTLVKIIELMVEYRRCFQAREEMGKKSSNGLQNSILSYIYFHSAEHLTLEKVADVFYISESSLSKKLNDLTGTSFTKLLNDIRIEKASDYLIYTGLTLEEVTDHLYRNFEIEKLHAGNVAEKYDITLSELNRSLLYYTGMNFSTLLNFIRINKASEMLVSSSYSILDISVSVGYSNIKTFNLNFYKFKGMTPTEFRESITLQRMDGGEKHYKNKEKEKGL